MSIVYPIAMPTTPPGPKQIVLAQNFVVAGVDSPFTAQEQIYEHQGSWWTAKIDLPPMKRATAAPWLAFLAALNGKSGTFLLGDPLASSPIGGAAGTPSVNGSGQTGKTLVIQNLTGSLAAGDYIGLGSENRLLFSQAFDNAAWQLNLVTRPTADTIVDPAGGTTAEALVSTASGAFVFQNLPVPSYVPGQKYTFSIWLKAPAGARSLEINISDAAPTSVDFTCSLTTSWQRFSVTFTAGSSGAPQVQIGHSINPWPSGIEIDAWGAQVELGSIPTAYAPTTTAVAPSTRRLHLVTTPGSTTLDIFPRLRESPAGTFGYVQLASPQGLFRLDSNSTPWTIGTDGFYNISFGAREAF